MELPIDNDISSIDTAYYEFLATERNDELAHCTLKAARQFSVHPDYIYSIAKQEAGTTGEYRRNADSTHDVGQMQINYERWAKEFIRLGFKVDWVRVLNNLCDNVMVGTKIIELRQSTAKDALTAMANYHYFRNVKNNAPHFRYKKLVGKHYKRLLKDKERFISEHYLASIAKN